MQTYVSIKKLHALDALALDDKSEHIPGCAGLNAYH